MPRSKAEKAKALASQYWSAKNASFEESRFLKEAMEAYQRNVDSDMKPHEWLLGIVLGKPVEQAVPDEDGKLRLAKIFPSVELRMDVAKSIGNYFVPRISTKVVEDREDGTAEALMEIAKRLPV